MADYREYQPCAALRPFVACYWTWRSEVTEARKPEPARSHRVLPDGCMDILFNVDPSAGVIGGSVVGAMTVAITVPDAPGADRVAVRFLPGGAYPFLRVPAHELTDQSVALAELAGGLSCELTARIFETADRVAALENFLLGWLQRVRTGEQRVLAVIRAIWQQPEAFTIDDLSARVGLGERQLERVFLQQVGLRPKQLLRVLRFQRALQAAARTGCPNWAKIAADHGYFDQAHLIRDCRNLADQTPRRCLLQQMSVFSNSLSGGRSMLAP